MSVMHTADLFRSDNDLAGLTLRCGRTEIEVLVILLQSLSPRARPQVSLAEGGTRAHFTATVAPPGTAILLPAEASTLASGPWQNLRELELEIDIDIDNDGSTIRGVIPLEGLADALHVLRINCPSR